jgi:Glycosyltransferase family 87
MPWRDAAARYRVDLILFVASLAAYAVSSGGLLAHQSLAPHFVYQAEAFLHGQLALTVAQPPNLNDWVLLGRRWYVSFPPFPAILMMPFVAVFGLSFNDVAFTLFFSAANVALLYRLLRRLQAQRTEWEHAALALIYGFGTLAWSCGIRGEVWFTAETIGVTLTLLYLHAALEARHPVLAGLAVGCAAITRTPLAFSAIFFVFEALSPDRPMEWAGLRDPRRWRTALRRLLPYAAAILAVAIPMAAMNQARFGSFSEFGHSHLYANRVNAQIQRYGLFHYAFLERNLHDAFTRLPILQLHPLRIGFNGEGMSLFVTTPLFFWLLWPRQRPRLHRALWLTVAVVALPGFFYQNSGYLQFGFRFSLDYTPYLIVLLALGARPFTRLFWAAALAGVAVNAWGAAVFNRLY